MSSYRNSRCTRYKYVKKSPQNTSTMAEKVSGISQEKSFHEKTNILFFQLESLHLFITKRIHQKVISLPKVLVEEILFQSKTKFITSYCYCLLNLQI